MKTEKVNKVECKICKICKKYTFTLFNVINFTIISILHTNRYGSDAGTFMILASILIVLLTFLWERDKK
jgi:hypothetical protein